MATASHFCPLSSRCPASARFDTRSRVLANTRSPYLLYTRIVTPHVHAIVFPSFASYNVSQKFVRPSNRARGGRETGKAARPGEENRRDTFGRNSTGSNDRDRFAPVVAQRAYRRSGGRTCAYRVRKCPVIKRWASCSTALGETITGSGSTHRPCDSFCRDRRDRFIIVRSSLITPGAKLAQRFHRTLVTFAHRSEFHSIRACFLTRPKDSGRLPTGGIRAIQVCRVRGKPFNTTYRQ